MHIEIFFVPLRTFPFTERSENTQESRTIMQFKPIHCADALRAYIRNYWILTYRTREPEGSLRIMTNGATSMMFFPGKDGIINWTDGKNHFRQENVGVMLNGPSLHNFTCHSQAGEHCVIGVEFHPAGVHAFFREPTGNFVDCHLRAEELGADFVVLEQQFALAKEPHEYTQMADAFFMNRLEQIGHANNINMQRMMKVFAHIESHHPAQLTVANLAEEACVSPRQFGRIFTEYVGLTPKEYLRIYRFHAALLSLREHPDHTTLMQLAWDNGYYDIQHMNSDFKHICRHTPSSTMQLGEKLTETFGQQFSMLMKKKILQENVE